jgi:serine protease Do
MTTPIRLLPWWPALLVAALLAGCQRGPAASHPDFADLVARVSPSVVNISTVAEPYPELPADHPALTEELPEDAPDWFRRYYEERRGEGSGEPGLENPESLGSGFVLWEDGYILTNYHVVQDAREVVVRLLDRRQFTAQVVGFDEPSDLALLKINATGLPAVALGRSDAVRPGQGVLAIGSPFGFDYSVTSGIVSAKGRTLDTEQYVPFLQTDAAINPGNSGGPLFNLRGEVIGVNSQIFSQTGGNMGVAFSIPIDVASKVARQLRDTGRVTRGWLGVVVQGVDRNLAQSAGMEKTEGALVARVLPGSPAEAGGVRAGDILLSFNGEVLPSSRELPPLVGSLDPGDMAELRVLREGRQFTLKIEIGVLTPQAAELAAVPEASLAPEPDERPAAPPLGLVIRALSPEERRAAQTLAGGVWVERVEEGAALRAGIRAGDILLQIGGQEITSVERYAEVLKRLTPGSTTPVLVQRRNAPLFLALDVPRP